MSVPLHEEGAPWGGRLSSGCGNEVLTQKLAGQVSVKHAFSVWGLTGKDGDHVWKTRCSELDLLGCDPDSGYAALRFSTRESDVACRSVRLRDGVRATPSRSPGVCRIVGSPPLRAPARLIPGRILLGVRDRHCSRPPLNFKVRAFCRVARLGRFPFPYNQEASQRRDSQASPSHSPSR